MRENIERLERLSALPLFTIFHFCSYKEHFWPLSYLSYSFFFQMTDRAWLNRPWRKPRFWKITRTLSSTFKVLYPVYPQFFRIPHHYLLAKNVVLFFARKKVFGMRAKCLKMLISHLSIDSLCTNGALFSKGTMQCKLFQRVWKCWNAIIITLERGITDQGNGFGMPAKKVNIFRETATSKHYKVLFIP